MRIPLLSIFLVVVLASGCLGIGLKDSTGPTIKKAAPVVETLAPAMQKVRDLMQNTTCEPSAAAGATSANLKPLGQYRSTGSFQFLGAGSSYTQIDTYRNRTVVSSPGGPGWVIL